MCNVKYLQERSMIKIPIYNVKYVKYVGLPVSLVQWATTARLTMIFMTGDVCNSATAIQLKAGR